MRTKLTDVYESPEVELVGLNTIDPDYDRGYYPTLDQDFDEDSEFAYELLERWGDRRVPKYES